MDDTITLANGAIAVGTDQPHLQARLTLKPPPVPFNTILFLQGVEGQADDWPNNDFWTAVNALGHTVGSLEGQGTLTAHAQIPTARVFNFNTQPNPTVVGLITDGTREIEFRSDFSIRTGEETGNRAVFGGDVRGWQITQRDTGQVIVHVAHFEDTSNRWQMNGNGRMSWGPGGNANQDTVLERQGGDGGVRISDNDSGGALGVGRDAPLAGIDSTAYRANGAEGITTTVTVAGVELQITNGLITGVSGA